MLIANFLEIGLTKHQIWSKIAIFPFKKSEKANPSEIERSYNIRLEDLKVLRRSSDLFNIVKISQGQLQLIIKHILLQPFWSSDLKQSNEYSIKQPNDF